MDVYSEVLQIIARAPQPVGWYGIEIRLGMKGIILDVPLPAGWVSWSIKDTSGMKPHPDRMASIT